jgi:hypothetical protein
MFYHYPSGEPRGSWKYCLTGVKGEMSNKRGAGGRLNN